MLGDLFTLPYEESVSVLNELREASGFEWAVALALAVSLLIIVFACAVADSSARPPTQEQSCVKICSPGDPLRIVVVPEFGVCAARIQM